MSLEKIKTLIEELQGESNSKLFIRELKHVTIQELIRCLEEIQADFAKTDLAKQYAVSEDLHVYYKTKYEEALSAIEVLELEVEEQKKKVNINVFRERSFDSGFFAESPQFERKRLKSMIVDDTIKMECDKNNFIEEEIRVISKEEDFKMQERIKENEKTIAEMEKERENLNETIHTLQGKIEDNRIRIEKLQEKNKTLKEEKEVVLNEKRGLSDDNKDLKLEIETLKRRIGFFEKKTKSISTRNEGLSTRVMTMSQEIEKLKCEKSELEESFVDKLNEMKTTMEKRKINEKYGEVIIKSEDFGAPIQKILSPKHHSVDQTFHNSLEILVSEQAEKITFRKTKRVSKGVEKFSKLNKYKTDFCFYDNSFFMEEALSEKSQNFEENHKTLLDVSEIQKNYLSDCHEALSKKAFTFENFQSSTHMKNLPTTTTNRFSKKKKVVCSSIFPNDEIKFVSRRKKASPIKTKADRERNQTFERGTKEEVRSCDPCRLF